MFGNSILRVLFSEYLPAVFVSMCTRYKIQETLFKKVQEGSGQEKAQSERNAHSKNRGGKTKLTIRYLYLENIS